jgi:hypothetical protein
MIDKSHAQTLSKQFPPRRSSPLPSLRPGRTRADRNDSARVPASARRTIVKSFRRKGFLTIKKMHFFP